MKAAIICLSSALALSISLGGCAAIPVVVATAPIWAPVVEAGAVAGFSAIADHFERQNGNAPAPVSRP